MTTTYFDQAAANWDNEPRRIALMKAIGEKVVERATLAKNLDILDYGCGTGLISLFLLPHVRSVTGADNSSGMLDVLQQKIAKSGLENMKAVQLDLERDPLPDGRYHRIVVGMAMHHIADVERVLRAFHQLLAPGGMVCLADLDSESGNFHPPEAAEGVHHHGFDRGKLKDLLTEIGYVETDDTTVATFRKPVAGGGDEEFSIFLVTAQQSQEKDDS